MLGSLRGINVSFVPMAATIFSICGFRLFWIFTVFPLPSMHTIIGLYACYPISWILAAILNLCCMLYYFRRRCPKGNELAEGQTLPEEETCRPQA